MFLLFFEVFIPTIGRFSVRAHEVQIRSYISARLVGGEFQISTPETVSTPEKLIFFPAGGENFWCSFGTKPFRNALFLVQKIYNAHQKTQKFASGSVGESSIMFYHAIMLCLSINSISLAKKFNCKYQSQSRLQQK